MPEPETVRFLGRDLQVIDLSQRLSNRSAPFEPMPHSIQYFDHADTIAVVEEMFGLGARHWRDGQVWAAERITLTTHSGTHIDAPYHYHPTTADGRPARKLDDLPFQWLMGDGVVLDMRHVDRDRPHGFHVLALPVSIEAASGAWARVVALVDAD